MAHHHHQQPTESLLDTLYCSEEHWEEELEEDDQYGSNDSLSGASTIITNSPPSSSLLESDMFWDDEELTSLLAKEQYNPLNAALEGARREAVEWMLKVNGHYSFSALTSVLAVNYLDRFLSSFRIHNGNKQPWMSHLAAVACLSLAAKVEETQVPLLLDLQVEESRYLFETKTIKRMEILVLSSLGWKMNPVTPLSFIDYIIRRLGIFKDLFCWEYLLRRCEAVLLSLIIDSRFMSYLPSELATGTMMHVVNSVVEPHLGAEYQSQILGILGVNKEKVDECRKLMLEVCEEQGKQCCLKRKCGSWIPGSPNGVMEVSFSCDSSSNSNDSWAVSANSVSSSPEANLWKKIRTEEKRRDSNSAS